MQVRRTNPVTGTSERLGVVGKDFTIMQNEEQVDFLRALLDQSGAFIETAGALRGGRQVFVTAKLPESMLIGGVDQVDLYVAILNGHDGSMALRALATPIRIVCANTQTMALNHAHQSWSRRHTAGLEASVAEAREVLALSWKFNQAFEAEAQKLIQTSITDWQFEELIADVFGEPEDGDTVRQANRKAERLNTLRDLYFDSPTQDGIRGTRWGALQAIGEYEDHHAKVKATDDDREIRRALRAVDGAGVTVKNRAFALLRV